MNPPPHIITTFAGTGVAGSDGDDGPATRARLDQPFACAFDSDGNLFIADAGPGASTIRYVDRRSGRITTRIASGLREPYAVVIEDRLGYLFIADRLNARVCRFSLRGGTALTAVAGKSDGLVEPNDLALDGRGGLLIADVADQRIRRFDLKSGAITIWGGTGKRVRAGDGGPVAEASFAGPRAVSVDPRDGTAFVCEREGNVIRRVDGRTGIVTTWAGTGAKGYSGDGGPALRATFNGPKGVRCDRDFVYVVDCENHAIRAIDRKTERITTRAGGHLGDDGDGGPAEKAGLDRPHGAEPGPDGALYISDSENHRVRRVGPAAKS